MLKLSIITINYNNAQGLLRTLTSVFNQTFTDFEYIVIDGGSHDGSKELLEKYSDKISYWVSEPDAGIYNAMNKGILKAKGEYLLFLNSGDWLHSSKIIGDVYTHLNNAAIIYGDGILNQVNSVKVVMNMPASLSLKYFSKTSIFHPSTFIKKELFKLYGLYNEENKIVSDWEFFINTILVNNVSVKKINCIISEIEDGGISRNADNANLLQSEIKNTLSKYFTNEEIQATNPISIIPPKPTRNKFINKVLNLFR